MPRLTGSPAPDGDSTQDIARAAFRSLTGSGPVGVAVSGGGDSMALVGLAQDAGLTLRAVTVDHGLRAEAAAEAEIVASFCSSRGIPHAILKIGDLPRTGNLSANLRDARYRVLRRWADIHGIGQIMLGHTLDDQAETVLMRLARGAGADGLAGMADRRDWEGIAWLRPLLGVRRQALRDWLRSQSIPWIEDPTNDDQSFDRVKARRALVELAPLGITHEGLADSARVARAQSKVLHDAADVLADRALRAEPGGVSLDREAIATAAEDTALRVLAMALCQVGGSPYRPRHRALAPLLARICGEEAFRVTLAGCLIDTHAHAGLVLVTPEPAASRSR